MCNAEQTVPVTGDEAMGYGVPCLHEPSVSSLPTVSKQQSTFLADTMSGRKVPDSGVDFCYVTVYEAHQLMKNDKALCTHGSMHVMDSFVS